MVRRLMLVLGTALSCAVLVPAVASAAFGPISSFGGPSGESAGQFGGGGLAIAPNGDLYVGDYQNARVDQFAPDGTFIRAFGAEVGPGGASVCTTECESGSEGGAAGEFAEIEGIAVGPNGDVYTVSWANSRVEVWTGEGQFVRAFGEGVLDGSHEPQVCTTSCQGGLEGEGAGEMENPYGVAVDPVSGDLFVTDTGNNRVDVYETDGTFVEAFGKKVNLKDETDICTEESGCKAGVASPEAGTIEAGAGIAFAPSTDDFYVADYETRRIEEFTGAGEFVRAFGKKVNVADESDVCTKESGCRAGASSGEAGALAYPLWDAFDATGNLYVGDLDNSRVAVYSAEGIFEDAFGGGVIDGAEEFQDCTALSGCEEGSGEFGPGSVAHPFGIAVGRSSAGCEGPGTSTVYVLGEHYDSPPPEEAKIQSFGSPIAATCPPPPKKEEKHETKPPSNQITLGKLKLNKKRGTALLAVSVPGPGALALSGKGVKGDRLHAPGLTTVNLPIALGGKAKKNLAETGKAKVRVTVAFTPDGGTAASASKSVTLKKMQSKKPKR